MSWKRLSERGKRYRQYLKSDHWKELRGRAIKRDNGQCVECGWEKFLNVHHKIYREKWEDAKLEDLETLCKFCHKDRHGLGPTKEQLAFEEQIHRDSCVWQIFQCTMPWNWKHETVPYELRRGIAILLRNNRHLVGLQRVGLWWLKECATHVRLRTDHQRGA